MSNYIYLSFEERCKIEELLNKRFRKYQIAKELGRTQSTISREINSHKDLHKSLYNYIDAGYFKDLGITNLSLKRKVKRKKSKYQQLQFKKHKELVDYTGRAYSDYLQYKIDFLDKSTTEMDTIYNSPNGSYIQMKILLS